MSKGREQPWRWFVIAGSLAAITGVILMIYGWADLPGDPAGREHLGMCGLELAVLGFAAAVVGRLFSKT